MAIIPRSSTHCAIGRRPPRPVPPWPLESRYPSRQELIFSARPIAWNDWILAWQRDQVAGAALPVPLADRHLLPGPG